MKHPAYFELYKEYRDGFSDAKEATLDILHRYIYGPYSEKETELARKIFKEVENL